MSGTSVREGVIPVDSLIIPISGDNPSGNSLRYERIYDEIREARREDDDSISYGIWQYDLKRADWGQVESLCSEALATQTKDLQIAGWLAEAWMMLDGIEGLTRGLDLIKQLTERFWDTLYPAIKSGDLEYRSQFYDWLDKALAGRLVKLAFIPNELGEGISLADWLAAQRLDSVLKRAPNSDKLAKKAEERGQISFKQCHVILSRVSTEYGDDYLESLSAASDELHSLKEVIDSKFSENTLAFEGLGGNLDEMIRIYKAEMSGRKRKEEAVPADTLSSSAVPLSDVQDEHANVNAEIALPTDSDITSGNVTQSAPAQVQTREQAYKQLADIAVLLEELEPHSPAPQVLRRLISWQDKSLMDIFNEISSSPEDLVALMRFLGIGTNKTSENLSKTR